MDAYVQALVRLGEASEKIAALEAERDALRKDAERYRWISENAHVTFHSQQSWVTDLGFKIYSTHPAMDELDDAIDAAIAAKEPNHA